jgi:hypothetical protein
MKKISNFRMSLFLAWEWIKENYWFIIIIVGALVVNFMPMDMLLKSIGFMFAVAAVSWVYYVLRMSYLRRKLLKLTDGLIKDNDQKRRLINSQAGQIRYLQGKPVTIMDKDGNVKILQKGKDDEVVFTQN